MTFPEFLQSLGIIPPEIIVPGRWHRARTDTHPNKKNANVKLGESQDIGFAIDFSTMTEAAIWNIGADIIPKVERTAEENAALSRKLAQRRAEELAGIARSAAIYGSAGPLLHGNHAYLQKKKCDMLGCRGLRVDEKGWLIVPMFGKGKVISIQRISPDGEKKFAHGAPTKWTHFRIWRPGAVITILCEGLATGLTLFAAVQNAVVEVCFTAANLVAVAEREKWQGMTVVAADNDHWTQEIQGKNPGLEAGHKAAKEIGCGIAIPSCEGTDFNDWFCERLAALEESDSTNPFLISNPINLRRAAMAPIGAEIMRQIKMVK